MGRDERLVAQLRGQDYWGGATWLFRATTVNGAGAGTSGMTITGKPESEFQILYCSTFNGDTSSRTVIMEVQTPAADRILLLAFLLTGSTTTVHWPSNQVSPTSFTGPTRMILSGEMIYRASAASVAGGQDLTYNMVARLHGEKPVPGFIFTSGGSATIIEDSVLGVP